MAGFPTLDESAVANGDEPNKPLKPKSNCTKPSTKSSVVHPKRTRRTLTRNKTDDPKVMNKFSMS